MTKTVKRILTIVPATLLGLLIAGGAWIWSLMSRPLYQPGMVRAESALRSPLLPPPQPDDPNAWRVEPDIELYHFSQGSGPPILFVHGGPGFPVSTVPPGLANLAAAHEVHSYHQRGCGKSTKPFDRFPSTNFYRNMLELDRTLGLAAQIADIERIRQILKQNRIILVGHSFGGFVASLYAAEFPEHVEAMILAAPANLIVFPQKEGDLFEIIRERIPEARRAEFDEFKAEYLNFADVFTKSEQELAAVNLQFADYFAVATGMDGQAVVSELEAAGNGGWMVTATFLGLGRRHDYSAALRAVDAPVLVLHGEKDLQPESVSRQYADLFANGEILVVKEAGHMMLADRPNETAEAIAAFLERVAS